MVNILHRVNLTATQFRAQSHGVNVQSAIILLVQRITMGCCLQSFKQMADTLNFYIAVYFDAPHNELQNGNVNAATTSSFFNRLDVKMLAGEK